MSVISPRFSPPEAEYSEDYFRDMLRTLDETFFDLIQTLDLSRGLPAPAMTTAQRDAIAKPQAGAIIFNLTTVKHEGFDGTTWNAFY